MRLILSLMALCLLAACSPEKPAPAPNETFAVPQKPPPPQSFKDEIVPAKVFPEATEVRLFINPIDIEIDEYGHLNKGSFPKRGIMLTSQEMRKIQKSVYYEKLTDFSYACCIPRHSFLFYDKRGKYLGEVTVCFECGCVLFSGAKPPSKDLEAVSGNFETFANIVKAHGQKTKFELNYKSE